MSALERYRILPRNAFYLPTVLVFILTIISALPADEVICHHAPRALGGGKIWDDGDVHDAVHNCDGSGYPGEGSRFVIAGVI